MTSLWSPYGDETPSAFTATRDEHALRRTLTPEEVDARLAALDAERPTLD